MKIIALFVAAALALATPARALQYPTVHFGALTLDAPLAVTAGGLGNATGDASALTVLNGSVARSLYDRFGEVVNAADYGVICDYNFSTHTGTDNTASLAAAFLAAQSNAQFGGKKLILPSGACLSGPQTITGQIFIEGRGLFSSVLVLKSGSTTPLLTFASTYSPDFTGASDAYTFVRDLTITSVDNYSAWNASNDASGIKVAAVKSTWFYFQNINIAHMPNNGLEASAQPGFISLTNSTFQWNGGWGIFTNSIADMAAWGLQVYFNGLGVNYPSLPAKGGGWLSSGDSALFIADINSFYNNGPGGWFYGPRNVTISGHNEYNGNVAEGIIITAADSGTMMALDNITFGHNSRTSPGTFADFRFHDGSGVVNLNGALFPVNHAAGGGESGYNVLVDGGATPRIACANCFFPAGDINTAGVANDLLHFTAFGGNGGTLTGAVRIVSATQFVGQTWGNGTNNFAEIGGSTAYNDSGFFDLKNGGITKVFLSAGNGVPNYFVPNVGFGGQTSPAYPIDVAGAIHATAAPLFDALTGFVRCNGTLSACSASNNISAGTGDFTALAVTNTTQYTGIALSNGTNGFAKIYGAGVGNDGGTLILSNAGITQIQLSAGATNYVKGGIGFGGQTSPAYSVDVTGQVNASAGYRSGGTAGVSCAAGTVSLSTIVVTAGIVTHC